MNNIAILLASFNGEKYLHQQLESIVNQSYSNWILYIRDDGSTDKSVNIINEFIAKHPSKIQLLTDEFKNLGSCNNFFHLLKNVEADYYMFADQDDVWNPDKIEITINHFQKLEQKNKITKPLLLHTDLEVVDNNLITISKSFWQYQKMDIENGNKFNKLLVQNIVTGCTTMFNKELKKKLSQLPQNVFVHDWWIALVASVFGSIEFIEISTIKYRQHNQNVAGAKQSGNNHFIKRLFKLSDVKNGLKNSVFQANIFLELYGNQLDNKTFEMLEKFSCLFNSNWFMRRFILLKYGILKSKLVRNIGLFIVA